MNRILGAGIILGSLLIVGCGSDEIDVTPPSMVVNRYQPEPGEDAICGAQEPVVFSLTGGDDLVFDVVFTDNDALSQYKIDIHNNFDCHGHGQGSAPNITTPNVDNLTTDWAVLDVQDIVGTSSPVVRTLNVPDNVTAGNYHFQIQVIDESGNDNPLANYFSLKIKNPLDDIAPEIFIDEPGDNMLSIAKGEVINFKGRVTDDRSLSDGGNGVVFLSYTDLSSGNTFATDKLTVFDQSVDTEYIFDFKYTVPETLVSGQYRFSIGANDGVRNVAEFKTFDVEIIN